MDAQEAEAAYRDARSQLDEGRISLDEYNRKVAELKYQDNSGTWRAINPTNGGWLTWDGSAWVPAAVQGVSPAPQATVQPAVQLPDRPPYYIPPAGTQPQPANAPAADAVKKPPRNWAGILGLICALVSWVVYPYIMGFAAIAISGYSLLVMRKRTGRIAIIAIVAIVIALAAILFDYYYLDFFVPPLFPKT
jgi:hypothetical protein